MVPAPTVRPPSRIAKRAPFSSATGVSSSAVIVVLSPGITISTPSGSFSDPRHVRRPDVELRPIPVEERRVPPALFLRQDVDLALELRVRLDRPRLGQHLPALHVRLFHAAQQHPDVVPRHARVQQLAEHLDARHHLLLRRLEARRSRLPRPTFTCAALDPPRHHRAAPRDREHVLDRHHERLVDLPLRQRNVAVERVHQLDHARPRPPGRPGAPSARSPAPPARRRPLNP